MRTQPNSNVKHLKKTAQPLLKRMGEHYSPPSPSQSKSIYYHIQGCQEYLYCPTTTKKITSEEKNYEFFKRHFKILQKSFRSTFERRKTEAFYIRVKRPDLNNQNFWFRRTTTSLNYSRVGTSYFLVKFCPSLGLSDISNILVLFDLLLLKSCKPVRKRKICFLFAWQWNKLRNISQIAVLDYINN